MMSSTALCLPVGSGLCDLGPTGIGVARLSHAPPEVVLALATAFTEQSLAMERSQEIEFVRLAGHGDAQAFRALSDHFLPKIVAYAKRLLDNPTEAEDVAQETFLRLWQQAARWSADARLSTWLFRVAHNLAVDQLRKRRVTGDSALESASAGDRPSGLLQRKEVAGEVESALAELPERQRAAVVLCHYEGLSNPEIAEVLEVGVEAVESLLARGRRALRTRLLALHAAGEGEGP